MSTPKSPKARAFPRKINVRITDIPRMEALIADIPYRHDCKIIRIASMDPWCTFWLRLKTQEILAFKLAGYEVRK